MEAKALQGTETGGNEGSAHALHAKSALASGFREAQGTGERVIRFSLRALFALVALLVIADLHSSLRADPSQWEVNPFLAAFAEQVGMRAALLCAKFADLLMLAGLYAMWRRSKAHVAVTLVLVIAVFEYAQIVLNNYQG
jgi:hypothetical protein